MPTHATVAVPMYNESAAAAATLRRLAAHLSRQPGVVWDLLVVDDGSADDTAAVVEATLPTLEVSGRLVRHQENAGLGAALRTAFASSTGDVVVTVDADLSYSVQHVERLVAAWAASGAAVVCASPYMPGGRTVSVPRSLETRSRAANRYLRLASGAGIATYTGMVRAYDGGFARSVRFERNGPTANVEILAEALRRGLQVTEVPAVLDWSLLRTRRDRTALLGRAAIDETVWTLGEGRTLRQAVREGRVHAADGQRRPTSVIDLTDGRVPSPVPGEPLD